MPARSCRSCQHCGQSRNVTLAQANAHCIQSCGTTAQAGALLEFLGRMLGKALYEGILLDLPLAGFFLKKFRTQHCDVSNSPPGIGMLTV